MLVPGYLAAYAVPNPETLLGLGSDQARTSAVFALLGIACATLLVRIAYADRGRWRGADCLAGALLLAGILGNTVDRLALGHVRDFLVTWAIPTLAFNVADLLLVVGVASLLMADTSVDVLDPIMWTHGMSSALDDQPDCLNRNGDREERGSSNPSRWTAG